MSLVADLRLALRLILRHPGHSCLTVFGLGMGIALAVTMFSVVHGLFMRGLPFEDGHELLQIGRQKPSAGVLSMPVSAHDFVYWKEAQSTFEDLAAWWGTSVTLHRDGSPAVRRNGAHLSAEALELLRVLPVMGRGLEPEDELPGAEPVALIGHGLWQMEFGGRSDVLNSVLRINGRTTRIIGVMPEGFAFPLSQDIWLPATLGESSLQRGQGPGLQVFGRLKPDSSLEEARTDIQVLSRRLAAGYPATHEGIESTVKPYVQAYSDPDMRVYLTSMWGAAVSVLLLACLNVAALFLGRVTSRMDELGARLALGADRRRLVRQLLTEMLLSSFLAGLFGVWVAFWATDFLQGMLQSQLRLFWIDIRIDSAALMFTFLCVVGSGLVTGLLPILWLASRSPAELHRAQNRGQAGPGLERWNRRLVVAEIACSCALLAITGQILSGLASMDLMDRGFSASNVVTAQVDLTSTATSKSGLGAKAARLRSELKSMPEVSRVALATGLPGLWQPDEIGVAAQGKVFAAEEDVPQARVMRVSPRFFETLEIPVRGRGFLESDDLNSPRVVILTESLASRHFGRQDPLGMSLRLTRKGHYSDDMTVVGLVPDALLNGIDRRTRGHLPLISKSTEGQSHDGLFLSLQQSPREWLSLAVRTKGPPSAGFSSRLRDRLAVVDSEVPVFWVESLEQKLASTVWDYRLFGTLFSVFGLVAAVLAIIGLYGVMSLSVERRRRELGVRMALGAAPGDIGRHVLKGAVARLLQGATIGLCLFFAAGWTFKSIIFNDSSTSPWPVVVATLSLAAFGALAGLIPALRAARIPPLESIRGDRQP